MLGCHEFCGYYEWTFHFVRRKWGQEAVARLWAEAIGGESQRHYTDAAREAGLAGLYRTWVKTGEDEACDWTFTLDEARNVLRWDMRQCPSKGFLLSTDRNADEDYCDHCTGWMVPLLKEVGVEVWQHEHNHQGQCWGTMRMAGRPSQPLEVKADVRDDPRWNCGYLDRWKENRKQPLSPELSDATDSCRLLTEWFAPCDGLAVLIDASGSAGSAGSQALLGNPIMGSSASRSEKQSLREGRSEAELRNEQNEHEGVEAKKTPDTVCGALLTDLAYVRSADCPHHPFAVLIGHESPCLAELAQKYHASAQQRRPLLLHPYLPDRPALDWSPYGLPRPAPILPLLIRTGHYAHEPGGLDPSPRTLLLALAAALGKRAVLLQNSDRD